MRSSTGKLINFYLKNDFLLALYTGGDELFDKDIAEDNEPQEFSVYRLYTASTLFLLPLSFLVIYFTEMDIIMQTGLLSTFVMIALLQLWWLKYKRSELFHILLVVSLLIALLSSVRAIQYSFQDRNGIYIIVFTQCLLWLWLGWRLKLQYLMISSIVGVVLLVVFIVL